MKWHNRDFFLVPTEERRRSHVATPASWKEYEPCRALIVPSGPVSAYKANARVDVDEECRIGRERDMFVRVAIVDHSVMVIMQF